MSNQKKGIFGRSGGDELPSEDHAFLSQIEENIRSKTNDQADAASEAEHRAREMERLRLNADKIKVPGISTPAAGTPAQPASPKKQNPLENDPRYKEYFQRLRRQKGESSSPTPVAETSSQEIQTTTSTGGSSSQKVGPGSIVRFDDGSIGIYKDAVSGRDYALFYFLNPDGNVLPEGVFLQCYQARVIGQLPEHYFAQLRDAGSWKRDMIVFHLSNYEFIADLDRLAEHEERKPKHSAPPRPQHTEQPTPPVNPTPTPSQGINSQTATPAAGLPSQTPLPQSTPEPKSEDGLLKGRRFRIKFGGKQWEAVYWMAEDDNCIVAHSTHGTWSLMRLDLSRFKDSLELGDIVDSATLEDIAAQAIS